MSSLAESVEERLWHCKAMRGARALCQPEQDQGERCGCCLHIENPAAHGCSAINSGDDHAQQKEGLDLEREARIRMEQAPDQACGEEAVIKPLIGGEHRRFRCLLD